MDDFTAFSADRETSDRMAFLQQDPAQRLTKPTSASSGSPRSVAPPVRPLQVGDSVAVSGLGPLLIDSIAQRNWSRVGTARNGSERFFIKQFIDRVSRPHRKGYDGDWESVCQAGSEVAPGIKVIPILGRHEERLLTVSPFIEMSTVDTIYRHDDDASRLTKAVGEALCTILEQRRSEDGVRAHIWKGLDPKNLGRDTSGQIWVFDFGPQTVMPTADAAARVAAAGLLSRWVARPGLHVLRPERELIRNLCEPIAAMTDRERVNRELDIHAELRLREPQREGVAAAATRLGLLTLGRIHWFAVRRECNRIFPAAGAHGGV